MAQYLSNFLNTAFSTYTENDAFNDSVVYPITLTHTTTGTPANGIGTGLQFITETSNNNNEIGGLIEVVTTDVTSGSEDFDFIFKTMAAGATAAEKLRIKSTGEVDVAGNLIVSGGRVTLSATSNRDKYRLWNNNTYIIGLEDSVTYGGISTEKAMTFQMDNNSSQGFWWGDSTHTTAQGAMALTTDGKLSVAHSLRLGYGESDTTTPGATFKLDVNGNIYATGIDFGEVSIESTTGIDSWKYNGNLFDTTSEDSSISEIVIDNTNGFYLLATGSLASVYKYAFTTAYKVDTLNYLDSLDVSAEELDLTSLFVKADGTTIYIVGTDSQSVHQYDLSTAWNLSTASYVDSKDISTEDTLPQGLFFKPDGTKMYILGQQNTKIYEYNLGTAWDITSATYSQQLDISAKTPKPTSMKMSSDGVTLYILDSVHDAINKFTLSSAWNITSATHTDEGDISTITPLVTVTGPTGFDISSSANKVFVSCSDNDKIFEYDAVSESARVTGNRLIVDEDIHVKNNLIVYNNARVHDALEVAKNLAVNGNSITTVSTTFNLLNNNVDTLNIASEASFIDLGSGTSLVTLANDASVQGDLTVLGTLTGTLTGSASSWTTARTITLGGDLTGNVSIDGTANVTLTATIAANSVALGTDTTGNYVASVGAGTSSTQTGSSGLTITGTGEGASVTIAHADTSSATTLNATSRTYVTGLTFDTYGHVTAYTTGTESVTDTNTTYSVSTESGGDAYSEIIRLTAGGSGSGTDDITLAVGAVGGVYGLTIAETGDTITFAHADTSSVSNVTSASNTFVTAQTYDTYGHVASTTTGTVDFNVNGNYSFTSITDGTNTAVADSNADTFKIRAGQQITVTVASDDVTHGDSVLIGHSNSGVTANSYGSSTSIPTITVDAQGHVTSVTTNSISTSWTISDGSNTQTIDGGNTLLVNGTTNEIEVAVSATDTLTIGLPNNVTIGNNLTVTGTLTVNGTTTTVNSTTVTVDDPVFTLGGDTAPSSDDNKDRGIEFRWHNGSAAKLGFFGFDDSTGQFTFIPDATNTSEVFSGTKGILDVASITGSAASWTTGRTITLTGDVTGTSGSFDGSGNLSFATTIAANSVALGTDTTGNYVASITNGSYITGGNGGSEGAALTLAVDATSANTVSKVVARDSSGNFSAGTITAALSGNASTASAWATGRTITLTGDVTGVSGSWDGSSNISFATTIAANSVALGTDTTGNYVASITNGSYITGGNGGSEGAGLTLAVDATTTNTASKVVARDANGDFAAGTITAALIGNASTATTAAAWTTGRTITLTGDVTGVSGSFDGSGNISFATTIAANSVALGTDTTGNYVATVGAGTSSTQTGSSGLTITGTGEGASVTIAHADTSTLTGAQGSAGIAAITLDGFGHVTAVTTATYLTSQANNFATVAIGADAGYTWGTANTNTNQTADSATDTITIVRGLTGTTAGIDLFTNTVAGTDAIKIAHADTSSLSGAQGSAGIAAITVDEMGHVTAVTTATYLTSQSSDFGTITVTDTDSGYTWAETGSAVADATGDTLTLVSGTGINIDVDATNDAIRITNTFTESDTLATVTGRGATTSTAISITNATNATTTSTGALKVTGGVGIGGDLFVGGGDISAGNVATNLLAGNTTTAVNFATAQTSGALTIGGTAQTGTITLDRSTSAHTLNIATGANTSGTKTVNIATGSSTTGVTALTLGSTNSTSSTIIQAGSGKVRFNIGAVTLYLPTADGSAGQVLKTDGAGNLSFDSVDSLSGGIANIVEDTSPQLGGNLDVNGQSIVSVSNGNILITPDGTGYIQLDGLKWPTADGSNGYLLQTNGAGQLAWTAAGSNTTYTISAETATNAVIRLTGSDASTDDVAFVGSGIVSVARTDANTITITGTEADTLATVTGRGATTSTAIAITNTTSSTTVNTGALTVDGGVGLNGNLFVGGTGNIAGAGTITGNLTVSGGTITAGNVATTLLGGNTTTAVNFATAQTSGALTIGGTAQTGTITLDRSTVAHTLNIATGVNASGVTKTINFGTGGASGSTTAINIGSSTSGATNTVNIYGNLTVTGTTTYVNTTTLNVGDNIITLNADEAGTPSQNAGIEIERGTSTNTALIWNETTDRWQFTNDGSTYFNIPISSEYSLITANSVALGTDTTGNYVATVAAGTPGAETSSSGLTISAAAGEGTAATIAHADTSALSGAQGTAGIAAITVDGYGHVTAVTTATYLTAEADTLATVTGRGATTATAISITNATNATTTATGALKVTGGVGIGGDLFVGGGDISAGNVATNLLAGNTTTAVNFATAQTSGALTIGGTAQTGIITFDRSASAHTTNYSTGANASAVTKTINFGTGGVAGSTTNITVGSNGGGTLTVNSPNTTFNQPAAGVFKVQASAAPTTDMAVFTNTGQAVTTAGVNALAVTYVGGASAAGIEASAMRIDLTPGGTPTAGADIWSGLRLTQGAATSTGVTVNVIKADAITAGTGTDNVLWVGTGYDSIINYNGTPIIAGDGSYFRSTSLGSATAPAFSFTSDPNTGIYSSAADTLNITTGGTLAVTVSSAGAVTIVGDLTVSGGDITAGNVASTLFAGNTTTATTWAGALTSGALTIGGTATTGTITFDRSASAHTLNIATGANASAVTKTINFGTGGAAGSTTNITVGSNGGGTLTVNSPNTTFNQPAAGVFKIQASQAPTTDMVQITNTGFANVTAGVNALAVTYVGGAAAVEGSAMRIDLTPGATTGGTWSGLRLTQLATTATGVTVNVIKADAITAGTGTDNVLWVGTGYNSIINYNGSSIINGTATTITGSSTLTLNSVTTNAITLDSGTTGAVNIGTNANAKTITIGNGTGATSLVLNAGTGAINIGTNAIARTITVGNATGASALSLQSGTGAINIGTSIAKTITVGNVTGATGIVLNSGTAGVTANMLAAGVFKIQASQAPTSDMVQITNTGFANVTAGVNALAVTYVGGAAAVEGSAMRIDLTPGGTTGGTWSGLRLTQAAATATGVTVNVLKADAITAGAGTDNVLWVGTGYDSIINYNGTTIIDGTGQVVSLNASNLNSGTVPDARLSGTYSGFTHKLDGSNTIFTTPNSGSTATAARTVYGLAEYKSTSAAQIGALVFIAPNTTSTIMHQLEISGMLFNQHIVQMSVQGYRTTGAWSDVRKISTGTVDVQTRWAVDPSGRNCLILGDVGTSWAHPHFSIIRAMFSHSGVVDSYCSGWTVAVVTDLSLYTQLTSTIADSTMVGSISGSAATLTTARTIALSGDVTGSASFNGSANITIAATIAANSVALGTDTTGNYVAGATAGNGITITGTAGEGWSPTIAMSGSYTGTFTATGDICAYSDITLKENVEIIADPLDKVLKLRGVTFTRKDLDDNKKHMGVIAQEVEEVIPEVVVEDENGIKTVAYGNMVGLLIEAVKELTNQNKELLARIEQLEKK